MRSNRKNKPSSRNRRRFGALCLSAGVAAGVMLPVNMASADEPAGWTSKLAEAPGVPEGLTPLTEMPAGAGSPIPEKTREAISALSSSSLDNEILEFKWNHEDASLTIFAHDADAVAAKAEALFPPDQEVSYASAAVTKAELESTVENFVATLATSPQGLGEVVSVTPSSDGSKLTVGVTELPAQARRSSPLPSEVNGIEVAFEQVDESLPTTRIRNTSPIITGGYFEGQAACSTGWPVRRAQDTTYGNLSADHCGTSVGSMWTWGTSGRDNYNGPRINVGQTTGQAAGGSDLEVFLGSTASAVYPYVYTTNNNDSTTGIPIRGYANTVVGDRLCYSGAFSGMVCGNEVTSASSYICYAGFQCYWIATTTQIQGQPAVGNGDSGGPLFGIVQRADGTLGAYGVGINSGITGGTTSCTGDAGYQRSDTDFRLCSKFVMFAPVTRFLNAQSNFVMLISPN